MKLMQVVGSTLMLAALANPLAAWANQDAQTEEFLKLVRADKLTAPVYAQVQQMLTQVFVQSKAPESKKAVLERYQAKANAELDRVVGWSVLKPDLIKLYNSQFSEAELKALLDFYKSPVGKKVLEKMPELSRDSAQLTQDRLQQSVAVVNKLTEDMRKELGTAK